MKNLKLLLLVLLVLPFTGCAIGEVFWVSQTTLDQNQFGQVMLVGQVKSEIDAKVEVDLGDGLIYPDRGVGSGAFVSHRATFWVLEKDKWQRAYGILLQPHGLQKVRASSTLHGHHLRVKYRWRDRFNNAFNREIDVKIYPVDPSTPPPHFEIVLVANPGREPIRDH